MFENPHTGCHQMSHDLWNVYYLAFLRWLKLKHCDFHAPRNIQIVTEVKCKLTATDFLPPRKEFGLHSS